MWSSSRLSSLALLALLRGLALPTLALRDVAESEELGAAAAEEADLGARADLGAEALAVEEAGSGAASGSGLQAGSVVLGRYELVSLLGAAAWPSGGLRGYEKAGYLGRGAFGEAWLAVDKSTGEQVAVKFFYREGYNGAVTLLNLRNANAQERGQLQEAGTECDTPRKIIGSKSAGPGAERFALCYANRVSDPQYSHLVLQVAGSESLEDWARSHRGGLAGGDGLRLAKMMLEGLAQMEGKYVHRDIKPANLMVYTEGGKPYLRFIDFGLVVSHGKTDYVGGTPMFMPPEVWPVVPRSPTFTQAFDVYSTGETLYWLLCGFTFHEKIFNMVGARGETEIKKALVSNDPRRFCTPPSALSALFEIVVGQMMSASPQGRSKASQLLAQPIFQGVETSPPGAVEAPQQTKPSGGPGGRQPARQPEVRPRPVVVQPEAEKPAAPTFMDMCHGQKAFWFQNLAACCLQAKYDPKREAVCQRPCGPKVAYQGGQCASNCQATSSGQFEFSKAMSCCVATVWKTKCIYPDHIPSGEGWRWMAAEGM